MVTQVASSIELIVIDWLTRRNIDFRFQTSLGGGFFELGGAVVDVLLTELRIAIRIQGGYWHRGVEKSGQDEIQREMLTALGWTVVDLWEDDLLDRLETTMQRALRGEEMLR